MSPRIEVTSSYPPEFRAEMVRLVRSGRTPEPRRSTQPIDYVAA